MSDSFAPPSGPPPPKVPEGWKAVWNNEYKEWFYVSVDPPELKQMATPDLLSIFLRK
jgi:hypothetical protein